MFKPQLPPRWYANTLQWRNKPQEGSIITIPQGTTRLTSYDPIPWKHALVVNQQAPPSWNTYLHLQTPRTVDNWDDSLNCTHILLPDGSMAMLYYNMEETLEILEDSATFNP